LVKNDQKLIMRSIALCFKPFLKPEEALIYCNLGRTQFAKNCEIFEVYKNSSGYFKKRGLGQNVIWFYSGSCYEN